MALVRKESGELSLDAGCGKGAYFKAFRGNIVGFDLNKSALKEAKKEDKKLANKEISLVLGDIKFLPFRSRIFGFILCSQVIEHLNKEDAQKTFREFERLAQRIIVIDTPNASFTQTILRKIFVPNWRYQKTQSNAPLDLHRSFWTKKKLENEGFKVNGCLGWVTKKRLNVEPLAALYDYLFWNVPFFAGTLIGVKILN